MARLRLRIRLPSGQSTLDASTMGELTAHINGALETTSSYTLLAGYPPQPIEPLPAAEEALSNFLKSGDTIVVRVGAPAAVAVPVAPPPAPLLKRPAPEQPAPAAAAGDMEDEEMQVALALSLGQAAPAGLMAGADGTDGAERITRRVVPADNSCLFAAVAHAMHGNAGRRERADGLRQVVAGAVRADPIQFSEAMLGQDPDAYCAWITRHDTWGGHIELAILSKHFGVEIAAFDIQTTRVDLYGQGEEYPTRILLLYDGVHYDLLVKTLFDGAPEELDVSVFDAHTVDVAMVEAHSLVAEQHGLRKFTDTSKFTLRCLVCQKGLVGEAGALEHAKSTGHANFCEFK